MGAVAVVVPQPIAHGDGDVVVVMEPPPVGELSAETRVIAFDEPVLPGRAGVDGERADATVSQAVADDSSDKLGPVVGADVLGGSGRERPAEAPAGPAAIEFLARDLKGALLQQQAGDHLLELLIILLERSQGLGVRAGHHAQLLLPAVKSRAVRY
jgi:hypothetical protein